MENFILPENFFRFSGKPPFLFQTGARKRSLTDGKNRTARGRKEIWQPGPGENLQKKCCLRCINFRTRPAPDLPRLRDRAPVFLRLSEAVFFCPNLQENGQAPCRGKFTVSGLFLYAFYTMSWKVSECWTERRRQAGSAPAPSRFRPDNTFRRIMAYNLLYTMQVAFQSPAS